MGYDLSCTLGYGVKIADYDEESLITPDQIDNIDALYSKESILELTYGGTDDCRATFVLHKDSLIQSSWSDYEIYNLELTRKLCRSTEYEEELIRELKNTLDIEFNSEYYKWYMIPLWF